MTILLLAPLALAQAGVQLAPLPIPEFRKPIVHDRPVQSRMAACLDEARIVPDFALVTAAGWLAEAVGGGRAAPQQCLGIAYISLLNWTAAESAFLGARAALLEQEHAGRARLAAMAGNAALAAENYPSALTDFELAQADALASSDARLAGDIAADRARALVGLNRFDQAELALADARRGAAQDPAVWLLSATLARRMETLSAAREYIEGAAALSPDDPAVALEAGLIAALGGQDDIARKNWHAIITRAPQSPEAKDAFYYLAQLDAPQEPQ